MEAKKGIEKERPKTAAPLHTFNRNDEDLEDFGGDTSSRLKTSDVHQRSNDDIQARKKSLFGVEQKGN